MSENSRPLIDRLRAHRVEVALFVLAMWAGGYFAVRMHYDNTRARYFVVAAVVNHGTFRLDRYAEHTIDTSRSPDGHVYSNKGVGLPLLGIPVYWGLRNLTPLGNRPELNPAEMYVLRLVTTTVPYAISVVLIFWLLVRWGTMRRQAMFAAVVYAVGGMSWLHGMMFSGHGVAASMGLGAFCLVTTLREQPEASTWRPFAGGVLAGWMTLVEYPAALIAIALTIYLLSLRLSWRHAVAFIGGGAVMALLMMAYNQHCFGSPLSLSYSYQDYEKFADYTRKGFMGIVLPSPLNFLRLTVLPARGLFTISPVLILAIPGYVYLWRKRELRREWWLLLAVPVIFLLWNSGYFGWHSGWMYGSRYLVVMLPFMVLAVGFAPWLGRENAALLHISVLWMFFAVAGCPYPEEEILSPLPEVMLPLMGMGYWSANLGQLMGLSGLWALLLFVGVVVVLYNRLERWTEPEPTDHPSTWCYLLAIGWLIAGIALPGFVRTPDTGHVHRVRAQLLEDYAYATNQPELLEHVEREREAWKAYEAN